MKKSIRSLAVAAALAMATLVSSFAQAQENFLGEIRWVPYNFAPRGWAFCDGQLLPIAQNTALFSLLGTTFGGDGRYNFALPDLRGRTQLHAGGGAGLTPRFLGEQGGVEEVALTQQEMPAHNHVLKAYSGMGKFTNPNGASLARPGVNTAGKWSYDDIFPFSDRPPGAPLAPTSIGNTGGGQPHENMQPFTTLTCIIALQGIFPSRD